MYYNTGDLLKVTITAIPLLAYFAGRSTSLNPAYDVTLAEHRVGACRLGKKENSLRKTAHAPCLPDNEGKNTCTHSEYLILIAVPRQQWLYDRASLLRYM
jgi:hypothetical protein